MDYISERIANIADLEDLIETCFIQAQILQKESSRKENFQLLIDNLQKAKDFEFKIERRKTSYCV